MSGFERYIFESGMNFAMPIGIEKPILFNCDDRTLLGILHLPQSQEKKVGVLIVVGGPQYRVGSHRQFVLIARLLSSAGYVVMRFDYSGMGDSDGEFCTFENVDQDIDSALIAFREHCTELDKVVLWGLCDGASAILMRAARGLVISGVVLVNPWVRTDSGAAQVYLKHYYIQRLFSLSFWLKLVSGKFKISRSIGDLLSKLKLFAAKDRSAVMQGGSYIKKMWIGMKALQVPVLLMLSERDLTAKEFIELGKSDPRWRLLLSSDNLTIVHLSNADHTFSDSNVLSAASSLCINWLNGLP